MSDLSITGHKGLIGKEDLRIGRGTFSRATSTGGTQDMTMVGLQTLVGEGAYAIIEGDGTTDYTAEIADKLAAIESYGSGCLVFGPGTYPTSEVLEHLPNMRTIGMGEAIIQASAAMDKLYSVDETDAHGNRRGIIENITLDGNDLADVGLYVGLCVQRQFQHVNVINALDVGCSVDMAQNNAFIRCDFEGNGSSGNNDGGGLRLNHGAGNNQFIGVQCRENAYHQLLICDTDDVDDPTKTGGFPLGPSGNVFWGGTIEVPTALQTSTARIRAGRYNAFNNVSFNGSGADVSSAFTILQIDRTDLNAAVVFLNNCNFLGEAAYTTAIYVDNATYVRVQGGFFENLLYAFAANDSTSTPTITLTGNPVIPVGTSVTNLFNQIGSATKAEVLHGMDAILGARITTATTSEAILEGWVSGDGAARTYITPTFMEFGAGNAVRDQSLARSSLDNGEIGMRFEGTVNGRVITDYLVLASGQADPATAGNHGTIFFDATGILKVRKPDGTLKTVSLT